MVLIVGRNSEQTVCYYSSRILKINRPGSQTEARPVVANTNVSFFKTEQPSATQSSTNGAVSATPGFVPAVTLEANKASGNGAEPAKRLINLPEPSGASLFNMGTPKVSVDTGNVKPEWTGFFAHQTSSSTEEKKTLSGPLFSGSTVPIATGGLFANILPAAEPVKAPVEEKPAPVVEQPKVVPAAEEKPKVENPTQPSSGLSGLFGNGTQPANGGLFGNTKPPGTSLFGDLKGGSSSLFGTNTSFFADTKVGGEKKDENKDQGSGKPAFEASGLFGATGTSYIKTKSGLFDGLLNSNVSNGTGCGSGLMGNTTAPETSLFSRPSGTAAAGGDDDEDAGVDPDEEVVPGQEDKADPSKATGNYKYESKTEVLVVVSSLSNPEIREQLQKGHRSCSGRGICQYREV